MSNMVVRTNVMALNSHRSLKTVGTQQSKASSRLSSGYKINSAADDAAGLAISEKMRAQIRGLDQASTNAQDAISLIQTAEGGMQEIDNMVQRIRELVVKASNDTNEQEIGDSSGDRQKIQDEIDQLVKEIDDMSERVEFNKKKLIDGSLASGGVNGTPAAVDGAKTALNDAVDALLADMYDSAGGDLGQLIDAVRGDVSTLLSTGGLDEKETAALTEVNKGIDQLFSLVDNMKNAKSVGDVMNTYAKITDLFNSNGTLGKYGASGAASADTDLAAVVAGLGTNIDALAGDVLDLAGTIGAAIGDPTAGLVSDAVAYGNALGSAAGTLYFQIGANTDQGMTLNIESLKTDRLGIGDGGGVASLDVLRVTGSDALTGYLDTLDDALSHVTTERAKLGAAQNRLEYTIKSLDISSENLSAAESRVRDTDMAKEMMNLTQANVLQQAATSMLAQANQAPQSVLQLLQ